MEEARQRAIEAHEKILAEIYRTCDNPSYTLTRLSIENITSSYDLANMEDFGLITFAGINWNGIAEYIVR